MIVQFRCTLEAQIDIPDDTPSDDIHGVVRGTVDFTSNIDDYYMTNLEILHYEGEESEEEENE